MATVSLVKSIPGEADYQKGLACEKAKVNEAFLCYQRAALEGHVLAQVQLGFFYSRGLGVAANQGEAFRWLKKAADQGDAHAECWVGDCYLKGNGVKRDVKMAFEWFKKGAEKGEPTAQCHLGLCYVNGEGALKDKEEAFKWFKKAAEEGEGVAHYHLGLCYQNGTGVEKNLHLAMECYREAGADEKLREIKNTLSAIGREKWIRFLSYEIGEEPPIPTQTIETYVLIPKGMTYNLLSQLVKTNTKAPGLSIDPRILKELGDVPAPTSYWANISGDKPPKMVEAVITFLIDSFQTESRWIKPHYTVCEEQLRDGSPVVVGKLNEPCPEYPLYGRNQLTIGTTLGRFLDNPF